MTTSPPPPEPARRFLAPVLERLRSLGPHGATRNAEIAVHAPRAAMHSLELRLQSLRSPASATDPWMAPR